MRASSGLPAPARRTVAVAIVIAGIAVAGCAAGPPPSLATGTVEVHVVRAGAAEEFFASEHHARLIGSDGSVAADWQLGVDGAVPVAVPVGPYTLAAFTVFLSDFLQCTDDPTRPGRQTCLQPTLGPAQVCTAQITVTAAAAVEGRFTILAEGRCRLDVAPPAPDPSPST